MLITSSGNRRILKWMFACTSINSFIWKHERQLQVEIKFFYFYFFILKDSFNNKVSVSCLFVIVFSFFFIIKVIKNIFLSFFHFFFYPHFVICILLSAIHHPPPSGLHFTDTPLSINPWHPESSLGSYIVYTIYNFVVTSYHVANESSWGKLAMKILSILFMFQNVTNLSKLGDFSLRTLCNAWSSMVPSVCNPGHYSLGRCN